MDVMIEKNDNPIQKFSKDKTVEMKKEEEGILPINTRFISVGLGWDVQHKHKHEFNIGCIFLTSNIECDELFRWTLGPHKVLLHGAEFRGTSATEEIHGEDDGQISFDLKEIPTSIQHITIAIHCNLKKRGFTMVNSSYIQLMCGSSKESSHKHILARFSLTERIKSTGALLAVLSRNNHEWSFKTCGVGIRGCNVMDDGSFIDVQDYLWSGNVKHVVKSEGCTCLIS